MKNYFLRQVYATTVFIWAPFIAFLYLAAHGVSSLIFWSIAIAGLLTAYGYNVGSHYAFTHKIFAFSRPVELLLIYASTVSAVASPISWAVHHFAHHRYTETGSDPHSPHRLGWRAFFSVYYDTDKADLLPVRHLLRDPAHMFADSEVGFWAITLSWPFAMVAFGGIEWLVYLWLLPLWYVLAVSVAFVFGHMGAYDVRSHSKAVNSRVLDVLSFGDGSHLEHHRNMKACGAGPRMFARLLGAK